MAKRKITKAVNVQTSVPTAHQLDYLKTKDQYLSLQDLEIGQKVYAVFYFAMNTKKVLPAVVIGIRNDRVRLRVPAPPGHDAPTFVKTIVPRFVTPRKLPHEVVDCVENKSQQERLMAMRA